MILKLDYQKNIDTNAGNDDAQDLRANLSFGGSSEKSMQKTVALKSKKPEKNLDKPLIEDDSYTLKKEKEFMEAFNEFFLNNGNALWSGEIKINEVDYYRYCER